MLLGYAVIWSSGIDLSCRIFKISADCLLQWSLVRLIHWLWDQCGDEQKKLQGLTISINFVPCLLCLRLLLLLPWQLVQYKLSLKMRQVRKLNSSWKHQFMTCICTLYCRCDWRHLQQCMSSCLIRGTPSPASGRSLRQKVNVYRRKHRCPMVSEILPTYRNTPLEHTLTS